MSQSTLAVEGCILGEHTGDRPQQPVFACLVAVAAFMVMDRLSPGHPQFHMEDGQSLGPTFSSPRSYRLKFEQMVFGFCVAVWLCFATEAVQGQPIVPDQDAAAADEWPAWLHALGKTATYETLASADAFILAWWWSGDRATSTGFAVISAATAATAYYLHEMAWNALGPNTAAVNAAELGLYKAVTYRFVSAARVMALSYLLTGNALVSGGYVVFNTVWDSFIYFGNELAWAAWGPKVQHLGQ